MNKTLFHVIIALISAMTVFSLSSCGIFKEPEVIHGKDGTDGKEIVFRIEDGYIQWQYIDDDDWSNLIALDDLLGPAGKDGSSGDDGREIELHTNDTHIQWRYVGDDTWNNLVELDSLTGDQGEQGPSAYEIYLIHFPDYVGDEEQWLDDLINGRLGQPEQVTISFEAMDGDMPDGYDHPVTVNINKTITLPLPTREGYAFMGWYTGFTANDSQVNNATPMTQTMTLYAKWTAIRTITFESNGGSSVEPISGPVGSPIQRPPDPFRSGTYIFQGWYLDNEGLIKHVFSYIPGENITLYAKWLTLTMTQVGQETTYTIPTGTDDSGTTDVVGGYHMATTQTTYELWYEVRTWAEANDYHFQNLGREGNDGTIGAAPTTRKHEPVTVVSWRDVVVWLNALSEMTGFDPVYRTAGDAIIKDSRDVNGSVVDAAIQTSNNGFRLPTSMEWEMAARWRDYSGDGSILVNGRWWTPGNYASGATANTGDATATQLVAWYSANSGNKTQPVGLKNSNHIGIHDMSGNVWEWTYTTSGADRVIHGGSYKDGANFQRVGGVGSSEPRYAYSVVGFRVLRNP